MRELCSDSNYIDSIQNFTEFIQESMNIVLIILKFFLRQS